MKTDAQLRRDVEMELAWDPAVRSSAIGVAVKDGVVTLSGSLETYAARCAAEKVLRRIDGVKAIAMEIDVQLTPEQVRSDNDIAKAADTALQWNTQVPAGAVRLSVDHGWITLEGEVEWDFQRRSAEKAVSHLRGVVGVTNDVILRHSPVHAG